MSEQLKIIEAMNKIEVRGGMALGPRGGLVRSWTPYFDGEIMAFRFTSLKRSYPTKREALHQAYGYIQRHPEKF